MTVPVNVSAPNTQNPISGATNGGAFDTQGRFTFGGITTTGVGGSTSTSNNDVQSYVAMAVIAVVVVAAAFLLLKK